MGTSGDPRKQGRVYRSADPRQAGGTVSGPVDDPHANHSVVVHTERAVLLEHATVCVVEESSGAELIAMALAGRTNRSPERTEILYLFSEDGAAAIITELLALAGRAGWREQLLNAVSERIRALGEEGALDQRLTVEDILRTEELDPDDPRWHS